MGFSLFLSHCVYISFTLASFYSSGHIHISLFSFALVYITRYTTRSKAEYLLLSPLSIYTSFRCLTLIPHIPQPPSLHWSHFAPMLPHTCYTILGISHHIYPPHSTPCTIQTLFLFSSNVIEFLCIFKVYRHHLNNGNAFICFGFATRVCMA